jgi:hypothetical protein
MKAVTVAWFSGSQEECVTRGGVGCSVCLGVPLAAGWLAAGTPAWDTKSDSSLSACMVSLHCMDASRPEGWVFRASIGV